MHNALGVKMIHIRPKFKAQSAMEYLMTYGWAILIIAVVLGALFSLGVFSSTSLLGTSCIATPGYLCQSPLLSHSTGGLTITFGQNTGSTIYNVSIACAATSASTTGLPYYVGTPSGNVMSAGNSVGFSVFTSGGVATGTPAGNTLTVTSGYQTTLSGINCFSSSGYNLVGNAPTVGTGFTGALYIGYNTIGNGPDNAFAKFATISVKAS